MFEGKTVLKAQNTHFLQLNQVVGQATKHLVTKIWKIFLSVFHDWKVHPQESREGSRESFWVNLATGTSTREQVAK